MNFRARAGHHETHVESTRASVGHGPLRGWRRVGESPWCRLQLGKGCSVKSHSPRLGQVAHCPPGFHLQEISRLLKFTFRIK